MFVKRVTKFADINTDKQYHKVQLNTAVTVKKYKICSLDIMCVFSSLKFDLTGSMRPFSTRSSANLPGVSCDVMPEEN